MNLVLKALAVALTTAGMVAPVLAEEPKVNGQWQTGPGDLQYRLELCGSKGELCGVMTYSRDPDKRLQAAVGTMVLNHAKRVGPQSWKGDLIFSGQKLNGTMTLDGDVMRFKGCAYIVVCGDFNLYRM